MLTCYPQHLPSTSQTTKQKSAFAPIRNYSQRQHLHVMIPSWGCVSTSLEYRNIQFIYCFYNFKTFHVPNSFNGLLCLVPPSYDHYLGSIFSLFFSTYAKSHDQHKTKRDKHREKKIDFAKLYEINCMRSTLWGVGVVVMVFI